MHGDSAGGSRNNARGKTEIRPLGRDILWSGARYLIVFSRLKGLDRSAVATRLDWLVANNPRLALERFHRRGSREYQDRSPSVSPKDSVLSVRDPLPGRGPQDWATEFLAESTDAVLRVNLVGDDCYFVVSHLLGDFFGVLPLCEFVLLGGDGRHLVDLAPTGFPVLARAVRRRLRRRPVPVFRACAAILFGAVRALCAGPVAARPASDSAGPGPISVVCWPKAVRGSFASGSAGSGPPRRSSLSTPRVVAVALQAAAGLGLRHHASALVLVDCRHWLGSSGRPLLGNLASTTPVDTTLGVDEGNIRRQLTRDFRESTPLIRLMLFHVYGRFFARFMRAGTLRQAAGGKRSDAFKLVVSNLGEIGMMNVLRQTFPEAGFAGIPVIPTEGYATLLMYSVFGIEEVGILSNCQLSADDVHRWRTSILETLQSCRGGQCPE